MTEKEAKGVGEWWKGLDKNQQGALTGSLVGGGTFGAVNMLRQGKKNRFKNFLGGVAAGGLGGAAVGYGGSKLMNPKAPKTEDKPTDKPPEAGGAKPPPASVDDGNFVGTKGEPETPSTALPWLKRRADGVVNDAGRAAVGAGVGAAALPMGRGLASMAGPQISRGWHSWSANAAGARAAEFGRPIPKMVADLKTMTTPRVLAGPKANDALTAAAKRLGPTQSIELAHRLKNHGGFIDMSGRGSDPFLKSLHAQVAKDVAAQRAAQQAAIASYRAPAAANAIDAAAAKARAAAANARTPTHGAAAKGGFTGRTLGMRSPLLGALLGGMTGYGTGGKQ